MYGKIFRSFAACAVLLCACVSAQATLVTIDFESDTTGSKGPSFVSVDSSLLTFSDTGISIINFGAPTFQGLATTGSFLGLDMTFSTNIDYLSMLFGNDDPGFSEDRAVLTVFLGAVQVGQTVLIYNKNDLVDETINMSGVGLFDRANLIYLDSSFNAVSGLAEVVDNVQFNTVTVPEPSTLVLLGIGLAGLGLTRRRRKV